MEAHNDSGDFDLLDQELLQLFNEDFEFENNSLTFTQLMQIPSQQLVIDEKPKPQTANNRASDGRFALSVSAEEIREKQVGGIPRKTRQNTQWTIGIWKEWAINRNLRAETKLEPGFPIPENVAAFETPELLDYWMQRFILEIRRKDGAPYAPNTLYQIVCGLQRFLKAEGHFVNFFKEDEPTFAELRKTLDSRMKELTASGIGNKVNQSDPITFDDEKQLWESHVFDMSSAIGLSNAVFYYNGKVFGFRGYQEHLDCKAEQFELCFDHSNNTKYVRFVPRVRKNAQGGLKHRKIDISPIVHYEQEKNERSVFKLFEKYLNLIPRKGAFYRKPLGGVDENNNLRYSCSSIPQNSLKNMLKTFFEKANISTDGRRITNHSARVTLCTAMYNEKFTDKAVVSRSKHRSTAVHSYQREDFNMLKDISNTLDTPAPVAQRAVKPQVSEAGAPPVKTESPVPLHSDRTGSEDDSSTSTLTILVPKCVKKIVLMKDGRKIAMDV